MLLCPAWKAENVQFFGLRPLGGRKDMKKICVCVASRWVLRILSLTMPTTLHSFYATRLYFYQKNVLSWEGTNEPNVRNDRGRWVIISRS